MAHGGRGEWSGARYGDAQWSNHSLNEETTNGSTNLLPLITVLDSSVVAFRVMLAAWDLTGGLASYLTLEGVAKKIAGVLSIVGAPLVATVIQDEIGVTAAALTVSVSAANELQFNVDSTGIANKIVWHARVMTSEVGDI
jgi:hypothetical protein